MSVLTQYKTTQALKQASDYAEWRDAARRYDRAHRMDKWRKQESSSQYDYKSIKSRLVQLQALKREQDIRGLLFTLNEGIHGNMGGMGRASLYDRAKSGTKHLIEAYIAEIDDALDIIYADKSGDVTEEEKLDFFIRANHCFGHSALMLSGSGSLLFFHVGVVKALLEEGLVPHIISGASGGSIVGSVLCSHTDAQLRDMLNAEYFMELASQTKTMKVGLARQSEIEENLSNFLPDITFQESLRISGRMMNVSIAPAETHQTSRLLNATTAPSVLIRSAVMASAAVPGIFPAVTLKAISKDGKRKDYLPSRKWVDGSVSDDMPAKRLARLYGVNHYIVSQTNPYVLPFVRDAQRSKSTFGILQHATRRSTREWFNASMLILDKWDKRDGFVTRASSLARSVVNQEYMGDINIFPQNRLFNPLNLLGFPPPKSIQRMIDNGERSAWPKLEMIRQQTRIGRKLQSILGELEPELNMAVKLPVQSSEKRSTPQLVTNNDKLETA